MIVPAGHEEQGAERADQRHAHVFLRVPDVALGGEEFGRGGTGGEGGPPFDQLVEGADAEANEEDDGEGPAA